DVAMKQLKDHPVERATKEPPSPTWGKRVKPPVCTLLNSDAENFAGAKSLIVALVRDVQRTVRSAAKRRREGESSRDDILRAVEVVACYAPGPGSERR